MHTALCKHVTYSDLTFSHSCDVEFCFTIMLGDELRVMIEMWKEGEFALNFWSQATEDNPLTLLELDIKRRKTLR